MTQSILIKLVALLAVVAWVALAASRSAVTIAVLAPANLAVKAVTVVFTTLFHVTRLVTESVPQLPRLAA
jgi:cell shape-determining protein MreC